MKKSQISLLSNFEKQKQKKQFLDFLKQRAEPFTVSFAAEQTELSYSLCFKYCTALLSMKLLKQTSNMYFVTNDFLEIEKTFQNE